MRHSKYIRKTFGALVLSSLAFAACEDKMDEYYEVPSWIGGTIYEDLQSSGNYDIFLKGVDMSGFRTILNGKSILTVMAPDDQAMSTYLQEHYKTADIEKVDTAEVKKLIGFHILYYAFGKDKFINFRPSEGDGATEEQLNTNAGLFYKYRTYSQDPIEQVYDSTRQRDISIYHNERMLPVFSYRMFQTKGIEAKENYEYFYPETGWKDDNGFNVANAAVTEYERIARNGYIYKIDRVLKPLETIYSELKNAGKYNRILDLYDKSEFYFFDEEQTRELGTDSLFHHYHYSPLIPIDNEWGAVTSHLSFGVLAFQAYSIFAPTDEAFQNFFDEYWGEGGYSSLAEIDSITMQEIMKSCVYSQSIAFPGEIKKGKLENISGEIISINPDEVKQEDRIICSNGVLYGCSVLTPPAKFRAVTGPAFQYKSMSVFNEMLNNSNMSSTLVSNAVRYIMLYPDNEQMYNNAGIERVGGVLVSSASPNGINGATMTAYVNAHVCSPLDNNSILPTEGIKVLPTLTSDFKLYWYLKNGKITNSILFNNTLKYAANTVTEDQIWTTFAPLTYRGDENGWTNGHAYTYENLLFPGNYASQNNNRLVRLMINNRSDNTTEFFGWVNLLNKAGFVNTSGGLFTFMNESCFMLIPTTEAVEKAVIEGRVPGVTATAGAIVGDATFFDNIEITDAAALQEYIKLYFVPLSTASFTNYPYLGWGETTNSTGGLITLQQEIKIEGGSVVIESTNMNIYDDGQSLYATIIDRATGIDGKRIKLSAAYDYLPFVFEDGPAHFVEDMF